MKNNHNTKGAVQSMINETHLSLYNKAVDKKILNDNIFKKRDIQILHKRLIEDEKLINIAVDYKVSPERIRQIYNNTIDLIEKKLNFDDINAFNNIHNKEVEEAIKDLEYYIDRLNSNESFYQFNAPYKIEKHEIEILEKQIEALKISTTEDNVRNLNLNARIYNRLKRSNIISIKQLEVLNESNKLHFIRGLGQTAIEEIIDKISGTN